MGSNRFVKVIKVLKAMKSSKVFLYDVFRLYAL